VLTAVVQYLLLGILSHILGFGSTKDDAGGRTLQ
jgi:hypothetical protein